MIAKPPSKPREVNFRYMLTGLILLMLTGPVVQEYTALDYSELLEIIFSGSFLLFIASVAGNSRTLRLALISVQ